MARTRSGEKPVQRHRCLVEGCPLYGVWQDVMEGEEYLLDTADPRSHYWREHYIESERVYQQKLADQRQQRLEHYRLTGEILRPQF